VLLLCKKQSQTLAQVSAKKQYMGMETYDITEEDLKKQIIFRKMVYKLVKYL
jgi:hypothetical protein